VLNIISTSTRISEAFEPDLIGPGWQAPKFLAIQAIWDTGATNSMITQRVVDECGLVPFDAARVVGVHGENLSEMYLVNVMLPSRAAFAGLSVTKGQLAPGADMLIGMDIISLGDFAVTNFEERTVFSFRTPSEGHIDFASGE
jgi:predicted aspartyl protease